MKRKILIGLSALLISAPLSAAIKMNYTPIVIPNAVFLCDSKQQCQYYEVSVSIPLKEKYARKNIMQDLITRYVNEAVYKVDKKSNKDLSLIELDIKGHLYRNIDYIDRSLNDRILEKYLIDVKIKPR